MDLHFVTFGQGSGECVSHHLRVQTVDPTRNATLHRKLMTWCPCGATAVPCERNYFLI
jgi:hypothetical protein